MIAGNQVTSGNYLHYYKFTFGNTNVDWANKMLWPSGTWDVTFAEQLLNNDNSKIYSWVNYGIANSSYIYFVIFNIADGTISGSRFRSSITQNVAGAILSGDYVAIASYDLTYSYLTLFNIPLSTFTYWKTSGVILYGEGYDPTSKR